MARAPFNVLVFPYNRSPTVIIYAIFKRSDSPEDFWQALSGGGEGALKGTWKQQGEKPGRRRESLRIIPSRVWIRGRRFQLRTLSVESYGVRASS